MSYHHRVRPRWPRGTYMKLISGDVLKAVLKSKRMSYADLARAIGKSKGFVSHLTAERETTCRPETAEAIARWLDIPVTVLFEPRLPTSASQNGSKNMASAA